MKKCNGCGQSYPDEVEVCASCNTPLAEETYEVSDAEPRAERPETRKSAPGHKATGKIALFFLISLAYFAVIAGVIYRGNFDRYILPYLLGGLPMGICLALCLKNAKPGVGKLGVGSCLCGLAAVVAVFVAGSVEIIQFVAEEYGISSVGEWKEMFGILLDTSKEVFEESGFILLILVACEAISCFLIAWLTGRILRKKSNK